MSAPLLSVVMPTHNRPDQLRRAADSILTQQLTDLELIIVDDASDEASRSAMEPIADDPRVTILHNPESVGPGAARNVGIGVASGDLLGFCDDDDTWLPGAAHVLVGALEADPGLGAVSSWHRVVHATTGRQVDYRGPLHFGAAELLWSNFVALPFGIVRRALFADGLAFDPTLPPCEDWDFWLRCAQQHPIEVVPHVLYAYYQHGGARVTKQVAGGRSGLQKFADKHAEAMTPACRIYHRAVVADQDGGREAMARLLAAEAAAAPVATGRAASVLACSSSMGAVGVRRSDPALAARSVRRLLATAGYRPPA